jgi:hypothetical protein
MKSGSRQHKNAAIKALIIAQESGDLLITVIEPQDESRIPHDYLSRDAEQAKGEADALVQKHYRHDCRSFNAETGKSESFRQSSNS